MASKKGDFNTMNEILEARFKKIKPNVKRAMFRSTTLVKRTALRVATTAEWQNHKRATCKEREISRSDGTQ